jgi:hypothetical protein
VFKAILSFLASKIALSLSITLSFIPSFFFSEFNFSEVAIASFVSFFEMLVSIKVFCEFSSKG